MRLPDKRFVPRQSNPFRHKGAVPGTTALKEFSTASHSAKVLSPQERGS
jgi:hypothetical protein